MKKVLNLRARAQNYDQRVKVYVHGFEHFT